MADLIHTMADLKEEEALKIVRERMDKGDDPMNILNDSRSAMELVGKRFASSEYFIPDLIYSGEILRQISDMVKPRLVNAAKQDRIGKYLLGTVAGDIHDGFEVIDLGVDVPVQTFVQKLKETNATIVGLSGFLTLAFDAMKETIDAFKAAGLRNNVKIMIGGGQIDDDVRKYTGADAYRPDAVAAVTLAKEWLIKS
jgi:methanogenic corrinoid protein MtbC1